MEQLENAIQSLTTFRITKNEVVEILKSNK